jgi:hypothetical protein
VLLDATRNRYGLVQVKVPPDVPSLSVSWFPEMVKSRLSGVLWNYDHYPWTKSTISVLFDANIFLK